MPKYYEKESRNLAAVVTMTTAFHFHFYFVLVAMVELLE
jgi:hypothetical protein